MGKLSLVEQAVFKHSRLASARQVIAEIAALGLSPALVIDSASVAEIRVLLEQGRIDHHSLFSEPDDTVLRDEAPVFVPIAAGDTALLERLDATEGAEFVCLGYQGSPDRTVRHLRGWLSVRLPHDAPEWSEEDKPVLFRFYDPRILAIFLGTLTADEASAFNGPVLAWGTPAPSAQVWVPTAATRGTPPSLRRPDLYRIRPNQYVLLAELSQTEFETALLTFLNEEFAEELSTIAEGSAQTSVARAMQDANRIDDTRPGSIATLAVLHLLRPDIMQDDFIWSEVMGGNPEGANPKQRAGLLSAYHTIDLPSIEAFDAYNARLDRFWEFY